MGSLSPACCGLLPLLKFRFLLELRRVSVPCRLIEGPAPGAEAVCIAIIPFAARSAGNLLHRCSLLCSAAGRSQVPAGQPSTVGLLLQQPAHGHLCLTEIFTFRFFIEFLKENQVNFEDSMTLNMGQWLSIPFVIIGVYFMCFYGKKK